MACSTDEPIDGNSDVLSVRDQVLRTELDSLRASYEALELPHALAHARSLRARLDATPEPVSGALRAELYQYLAMLHFDRQAFIDSIDFYVNAAAPLVSLSSPPVLRARQLLCQAYNGFEDFTWLEMQLYAQLGRQLLERNRDEASCLYGLLLLIEGRAAKQHARTVKEHRIQRMFWSISDKRIRQACRILAEVGTPWEYFAREHFILLLINHPENDPAIPVLVDELAAEIDQFSIPARHLHVRNRLLGYWHNARNRPISATYAYRGLMASDSVFMGKRLGEAHYLLKLHSLQRNDYSAALDLITRNMEQERCCPPDIDPASPDAVLDCKQQGSCIHFIRAQAEVYQQWAATEDIPAHGKRAFHYAQEALRGYEGSYRQFREESVLNKNLGLGDRIITAALTTGAEQAAKAGGEGYHEAVLHAMEFGKTLLLTREMLDATRAILNNRKDGTMDSLRQVETEILLLKNTFHRSMNLSLTDLLRFNRFTQDATQAKRRLERATRASVYPVELSAGVPSLAEIRKSLTPQQAMIQYAETKTDLYALYVDVDTSVVFSLPRQRTITLSDSLYRVLSQLTACPKEQYAALAAPLFKVLLGPAWPALRRRSELLVVPSSSLSELPFAALVVTNTTPIESASPPYLIQSHRIRYLASWRSEQQRAVLRRALEHPGDPIAGVWTNPDLDRYLSGLAKIVLEGTGSGGVHYEGNNCTSRSFLRDAGRYDWLQLSVHARGDAGSIHGNHLYLSPRDSLNGVFIGQKILRARLVVLAACSTARGYANRLEGTYSLRRSFHRAGVPDVVSSVYNIPAGATAGLLSHFYGSMFSGATPTSALADAQRSCLRGELGPRWSWPGYWAGMVAG
ncbi:CHAT domain-containing protein [Lewinella sp. JB7]|uniref:CHAT domain-containing protein n=1 Tax=Lewinella sp. JB7 TaxID=2962887 RepID=UPI0020C9DA5C|nr:CHAT domain-containing protein [Lewinella sp. JB7]MCP9234846.1 CHAT domain-containing protein [Lewinella sp. JB7]